MTTTVAYMTGRKKYSRPQAVLFSDNSGTLVDGYYIPTGSEIGSAAGNGEYIILSDDNRSPIDFSPIRIEKRERTVNGRMRSYHIADKVQMSLSWQMLPSRSFIAYPNFNSTTGKSGLAVSGKPNAADLQFTTDGGAGGVEILDWYETHKGSFWVFLAYDKYNEFSGEEKYNQIAKYNQIVEMQIVDFSYSVEKRSGAVHDLWNISMTLEEV